MLDGVERLIQEVPVSGAEGHVGLDGVPQQVQLLLHAIAVLHERQVRAQTLPFLASLLCLHGIFGLGWHGADEGGLFCVVAAEEVHAIF